MTEHTNRHDGCMTLCKQVLCVQSIYFISNLPVTGKHTICTRVNCFVCLGSDNGNVPLQGLAGRPLKRKNNLNCFTLQEELLRKEVDVDVSEAALRMDNQRNCFPWRSLLFYFCSVVRFKVRAQERTAQYFYGLQPSSYEPLAPDRGRNIPIRILRLGPWGERGTPL